MALMAVDYSPELSPLASPPSCLRHSSIMSRRRLTAPSAVHLALPRGVSARTIGDHFTARLAALVPAALLDHVTAAAHRAERGSPRTATGRLGSHDWRSFHRSPRRPRACGTPRSCHGGGSPRRARFTSHCHGASRLARLAIISPLASPPSCLRHSSVMSRRRLTAPSAVHLALPRGVSARTIGDHFTARLAALVPAATRGRLGSHDTISRRGRSRPACSGYRW